MLSDRLFLDTAFVVALLNPKDELHEKAVAYLEEVESALEVWTTEAVLLEVGNAFSASQRAQAADFIDHCFTTPNTIVVPLSNILLHQGLALYRQRPDKEWGLTDCLSFIVMQEHKLSDALTYDIHFQQAGFRAVLRENLTA